MPDWKRLTEPIHLITGFIFLLPAIIFACIGKAWRRYRGWIYRAKEPNAFWWTVFVYFVIGTVFIGLFLYNVS